MGRWKLNYEERISAVREYKEGKGSYKSIAEKYGIGRHTLQDMVVKYELFGDEGLETKKKNKQYSKELKQQAVTDYLSGEGSQAEISKKHKILNKKQLQQWVMMYNGHKDLKERKSSGTEIYMTKGRKTTQQERVKIVAFCIEHGKNYSLTISTFGVSYQQIYSWVRKYESKGIDGLADGRGKTKPEEEMTETEKLKAENKILQSRLKDKEMELAFLKKLKELERGGR